MTWSKSQRMLLFFPHGYPLDQSPLTMKLIRRYAESIGSQVALVTKSRIMKEIAREQGIPCFSSAPQAEKRNWKIETPKKAVHTLKGIEKIAEQKPHSASQSHKSNQNLLQKGVALLLLLGLVAGAFTFVIPSARVSLTPMQTTQQIEYQVVADVEQKTIDLAGVLPASVVSAEIEGELAGSSSGRVVVPKSKATGEVVVSNLSSKSVIIPKGTIVSTAGANPVEFYLKTEAIVGAGTDTTSKVAIEAVNAGASGNVEFGTIVIIGGLEGVVAVRNPEPTSGGVEQSFPTPTEADYDKLEANLTAQLLKNCTGLLASQMDEGMIVIEKSLKLGEQVTRKEIPAVGEPSDRATLSIVTTCDALAFSLADEKTLAAGILNQNIDRLSMPFGEEIVLEKVSEIRLDEDGLFQWTEHATRQLIPLFDMQDLAEAISGKTIAEAKEILILSFTQMKAPEIEIKPQWWERLPFLPGRITLQLIGN